MEGNQIEDRGESLGNLRFLTVAATNRYSLLDRYLMGLESEQNVPGLFYVSNPTGTSRIQSSFPSVGVYFGGTRKDFSVADIIAGNGRRDPAVSQSLKVHRQAFILLTKAGQQATPEQIAKLQNLHDAWVPYFTEQTGTQGWVVTNLQSSPATTPRTILFPYFHGDSQWYTGFALANWGTTPVDVRFTAYDNSGALLSQPAGFVNRRVVTIPPQAQVALLDAQVFDVSLNDPRDGWTMAESSSSQITGFFLEGDIAQTELDGAVAGNEPSGTLYFTRAQLGGDPSPVQTRRNVINVINPGDTAALLTLRLRDQFGRVRGTIQRPLNPKGRLIEEIANLFPDPSLPPFRGYVALASDVGVVGYQAVETDSTLMSLPAQPPTTAGVLYSAQFASGRAGQTAYFTELNLINTAVEPRAVQVQLIGNNGQPVVGIPNPFMITLQPGTQFVARGEDLFGLPDPASSLTLVEGSLVISAGGPGIIGDVSFGDPVGGRFLSSLPLDARPASNIVLSQVAQGSTGQGKPYFTGVALYNPNATDVSVRVEVYSESGQRTGSATIPLGGGNRISKTLPELVPAIAEQIRGYIRITAAGGPVVGYELFGTQSLDFLAAVTPQPIIP
jgi:hypothetical protein